MPILYVINSPLRISLYLQPIMHMLTNLARLVPILFVINRLLRIFLYIQPIMHMCAACTGVCAKHMHSLHTVLPATSFLCTQDHQLQLALPHKNRLHTMHTHMHNTCTLYTPHIRHLFIRFMPINQAQSQSGFVVYTQCIYPHTPPVPAAPMCLPS